MFELTCKMVAHDAPSGPKPSENIAIDVDSLWVRGQAFPENAVPGTVVCDACSTVL
jgi:hypothetical protein